MVTKERPRPLASRPRVSVVIPCYNYGHYLGDSVGSVLAQDGVEVDVTIVDDASPDSSADVARALAARDPRVRLIEHTTNQGHIATYNEGLASVDGEYVLLLSADDMVTPGSLARATALLEAHPEVGLVYGFTRLLIDTPPPARTTVKSWTIWSGLEWLELVSQRVSNPIYTPEAVMRTSTMRELAGYDARLPHAADFLLWLRTASRSCVGRLNGVDQAYYRFHGQNMHVERYSGVLRDLGERHQAFEILFDDDASFIPAAAELRTVARRAMAREALLLACEPFRQGLPAEKLRERVDTLAGLAAFAEEVYPASRESKLRQAYDRYSARAQEGKGPLVPPQVTALRDRVVKHAQWRQWRRSGIDGTVGSL